MKFNKNGIELLPQRKLDYETFVLWIQRVQSQLSLPDISYSSFAYFK